MISLKANRKYPSLPTVEGSLISHTRFLETIKESIATHERRSRDPMSSFVRVQELIDLGIGRKEGDTIVLNISAADIFYDNTASGLSATNLQDAIDEIASLLP